MQCQQTQVMFIIRSSFDSSPKSQDNFPLDNLNIYLNDMFLVMSMKVTFLKSEEMLIFRSKIVLCSELRKQSSLEDYDRDCLNTVILI